MSETARQEDPALLSPWCLFAAEALRSTDADGLRAWLVDFGDHRLLEALGGDQERLEVEYVRLFLHPNGAVCPPWQDAHGVEPTLLGDAHRRALAWYRLLGVSPPCEGEPADHAGLLLGFYGLLLNSDYRDRSVRFAQEHLAWLVGFGERMAAQARHPFYGSLGKLVSVLAQAATRPGS